ncbi:Uncharacterised protein [Serratia marcescens]|nr:Uncharacterised protein [Serratia marcescens]
MDNKLSELSKPKAFVVTGGKMYQDRAFTDKSTAERSKVDRHDGAVVEPLYSQEYVSALLARIAELEAIRADASQVFKEIGNELGCNPDNESIMMAIDALKERLATPVRLPVVLMGYQSDDYRIGFMEGVEKSGEEVRAAGFTVEGDE